MRVSRPRRWIVGVALGWMTVVQSFLYALMSGWLSIRAIERPARPNRVAAVHPARLAPTMATSYSARSLILPLRWLPLPAWPPSILHHGRCRRKPPLAPLAELGGGPPPTRCEISGSARHEIDKPPFGAGPCPYPPERWTLFGGCNCRQTPYPKGETHGIHAHHDRSGRPARTRGRSSAPGGGVPGTHAERCRRLRQRRRHQGGDRGGRLDPSPGEEGTRSDPWPGAART